MIEQLLKFAVPLRVKTSSQLDNQREVLRDYVLSGDNSQERTAADITPTEIAAPDFLTDFEMTGNLVDDLLQQPTQKADTLQLLNAYADDLTTAQLTDIITKMDITLSWEIHFLWMSRQANSHQIEKENLGDWGFDDWLEDNNIETVTMQEGDELYFPSLVPEWGELEGTDYLFQVLQ